MMPLKCSKRTKEDGIEIWRKALANITPAG